VVVAPHVQNSKDLATRISCGSCPLTALFSIYAIISWFSQIFTLEFVVLIAKKLAHVEKIKATENVYMSLSCVC
jgi:hypothetical protein